MEEKQPDLAKRMDRLENRQVMLYREYIELAKTVNEALEVLKNEHHMDNCSCVHNNICADVQPRASDDDQREQVFKHKPDDN